VSQRVSKGSSSKRRSDKLTNGLTFSDRDVDVQSGYGGGIVCGKRKKLEEFSDHSKPFELAIL
jgi:hypothetical protein